MANQPKPALALSLFFLFVFPFLCLLVCFWCETLPRMYPYMALPCCQCHTNHESRPGSTIAMVGFLALSGTFGALHDTSPSGKLGTVYRSARARHKEEGGSSDQPQYLLILQYTTSFTHLTSQRHQSVRSPPSRLPLYPGVTVAGLGPETSNLACFLSSVLTRYTTVIRMVFIPFRKRLAFQAETAGIISLCPPAELPCLWGCLQRPATEMTKDPC